MNRVNNIKIVKCVQIRASTLGMHHKSDLTRVVVSHNSGRFSLYPEAIPDYQSYNQGVNRCLHSVPKWTEPLNL